MLQPSSWSIARHQHDRKERRRTLPISMYAQTPWPFFEETDPLPVSPLLYRQAPPTVTSLQQGSCDVPSRSGPADLLQKFADSSQDFSFDGHAPNSSGNMLRIPSAKPMRGSQPSSRRAFCTSNTHQLGK